MEVILGRWSRLTPRELSYWNNSYWNKSIPCMLQLLRRQGGALEDLHRWSDGELQLFRRLVLLLGSWKWLLTFHRLWLLDLAHHDKLLLLILEFGLLPGTVPRAQDDHLKEARIADAAKASCLWQMSIPTPTAVWVPIWSEGGSLCCYIRFQETRVSVGIQAPIHIRNLQLLVA